MLTHGTLLQNRYRIESLLDMSSTGASYRAWDTRYELSIKLKELTPQPGIAAELLTALRERFIAAARVLTRAHHRHLVQVLDFFEENNHAYIVLDFVEGESLADWVTQRGPVSENQALTWVEQMLDALDYLHSLGSTHRNIKPQNIIIGTDGHVILVDFGLSPLWDPRDRRTWIATQVMGTPEYASPEQWGLQPGPIDVRSDVYSVGATWYYALTGEVPPTANQRMQDPFQFSSIEETQPNMRPTLLATMVCAMELRRNARFADAAAMLSALKYGPSEAPAAKPAALIVRQTSSWVMNVALALSVLVLVLLGFKAVYVAQWTVPQIDWRWWASGTLALTGLGAVIRRWWRRRQMHTAMQIPAWLRPQKRHGLWLDFEGMLRALGWMGGLVALVVVVLVGRWWYLGPAATATVALTTPRWPTMQSTPRNVSEAITAAVPIPPTLTPRPPRTPVLTPTFNPRPPVILGERVPLTWTMALSETFDAMTNMWLTTGSQGEWGTLTRTITDSRYIWEVTAKDSVGLLTTAEAITLTNFHLQLAAQRLSGPEDAEYGVALRYGAGRYYGFMLRDDGYFRFDLWSDFAWSGLLDWTETLTIVSGQPNRIGVTARAEHFELYINGDLVAIMNDATLTAGEVGVAIGLASSSAATFAFDDVWVYVPPSP